MSFLFIIVDSETFYASSLSDLKNRSENSAGRGQISPVLQVNGRSIDQKNGEIWIGQADLQPISFKSDRLLAIDIPRNRSIEGWCSISRNDLNMSHDDGNCSLGWCA